jgi:hypothetical protein
MKNSLTLAICALAIGAMATVIIVSFVQKSQTFGSISLGTCQVTHSVASVGHQQTRTVLDASTRRQWAIVQQPANASNTVSLSFGGTAVAGQGYQLIATSSIMLGFATDLRTGAAITARTASASSTVLVTTCQ